jgi:4-amino-4-deoxychorismate lyase
MKLLETIQIKNGIPQRMDYHNERMNRSRNELFCLLEEVYLEDFIQIPEAFSRGLVKCRVVYGEQVEQVAFEIYEAKNHDSFFLVNSNINYAHKYLERSAFNPLKSALPTSSEIIVVQNGLITDTSYSNLIFKDFNGDWWTPESYLLAGTQRDYLLDEGVISETEIKPSDLSKYSHFMMINALLDFDENRAIPLDRILR